MPPIAPRPTPGLLVQRMLLGLACACTALACTPEPESTYRGGRLRVATLPPNDVARAYLAALGASFSLDDPALSILVDPALLPRAEGLAGGDAMPAAVRSALLRYRFVKGTCQVQVERVRTPLVCRAARPGYVVRFSAPFALGEGRDSVQVHLVAQQYAIPRGPVAERLRFERAYQLVRSGPTWRAMGEARLPQP
ncbi:MAG: hypothetical protein ABR499_11550 [Gemmatimonadaceae bacterium]